jgi:CxC2 like cysteine cluster associated with KDZ transposases
MSIDADEEQDDNEGDEEEDDGVMLNTVQGYLGNDDASATQGLWLQPGETPRQDYLCNNYVRVVHVNGIHHIALVTCACHGAEGIHADLMYCRLVPATFSRYKTLFTVAVLDDFRISNLECKASAYQYFQKLRRLTFPMTPARTPNLYQELLRMARVWRWLKKKKWAGHGHRSGNFTETAPAELATFCPACPQPGINLPPNWKDDQNRCVRGLLCLQSSLEVGISQMGVQAIFCCRW